MKWISVKDRMPEICGKYLVWTGSWEGTFVYEYTPVSIRGGKFKNMWLEACTCVCKKENVHKKVTHWMPLPEPPENNS